MQPPPPWMHPHLMYGPPPRRKASAGLVVATVWAALFGVGTLLAFAYWILTAHNANQCSQWYTDPNQPVCRAAPTS